MYCTYESIQMSHPNKMNIALCNMMPYLLVTNLEQQ